MLPFYYFDLLIKLFCVLAVKVLATSHTVYHIPQEKSRGGKEEVEWSTSCDSEVVASLRLG
jgi:hypothetical protein